MIFKTSFTDVRKCQILPDFINLFQIYRRWGDHLVLHDTNHLYMNDQEWHNLIHKITARSKGDPLKARFYIARLQKDRDRFSKYGSTPYSHQHNPHQVLYNLYMDMIEEPEKYPAEDLAKLEEYDAILNQTSFKKDIDEYWNNRYQEEVVIPRQIEEERQEKQRQDEEALRIWAYFDGHATTIQALVRGHQERCRYPNRWTDCAHCLAHRVCKHQIGWRYWICDDCHNEEC